MTPGIRFDPGLKAVLAEATRHYRARDDDNCRRCLEEAVERAPHRIDIWFSLASHHIQTGFPDLALAIYDELAATLPTDAETRFCLAHWLRYAGDADAAEAVRAGLEATHPARAGDLLAIWRDIDKWLAMPPDSFLPQFDGEDRRRAIVALGYVLNDDGSMHPVLLRRLHKTLEAADALPGAMIVVTGGVPRSGKVEAVAMREWLVDMGVDRGRVFEEGYARDVVENLIYSRHILDMAGVESVLLVTSPIDFRRAGAGMEILDHTHGVGRGVAVVASEGDGFVDDGGDRLKFYRDALRVYGFPMMRCFPELVER